jgi:hypothetical protein
MYKLMLYGILMVLVMWYRPKELFGKTGVKAGCWSSSSGEMLEQRR